MSLMDGITEYVYVLIDERDSTIRYVGRAKNTTSRLGSHKQMFRDISSKGIHPYHPRLLADWFLELAEAGAAFRMEIVMEARVPFVFIAEQMCIEFFRTVGCSLANAHPTFGRGTMRSISELRDRLGLSQTEFADTIGKSLRQVQYYESGEIDIPKHVSKLIDYLIEEQEEREFFDGVFDKWLNDHNDQKAKANNK